MSRSDSPRVVILTDFASVQGGASGLALTQAAEMARRGLDVTMIAGDRHSNAPEGVRLVSLGGARLLEAGALRAATRGLWDAGVARLVAGWIADNDTASTVYHLHGLQQTLSPSVLSPLRKVADRLVIHAHDYFLACPNGALFDYRSHQSCQRVPMSISCATRHCDKNSMAQKLWRLSRQSLQNIGFAKLADQALVILLRPEMAQLLGIADRAEILANPAEGFPLATAGFGQANATDQKRGIVYIGDLNRYKGVLLLAEAARMAEVPLTFIGDGAERAALQRDWPEHRITGWLDRNGIAAELSLARAVAAPSLGPEPFGLAPVEALLSGLPVILADKMLITKQVVAARAGLGFAAGDAAALAAALGRIAKDDALATALARNAPAAGRQLSLPLGEWIDALLDIYTRILTGRATGRFTEAAAGLDQAAE